MKIYFENDPDKQEMLKIIIKDYKMYCFYCNMNNDHAKCFICGCKVELKQLIERITGDKIEEVLK